MLKEVLTVSALIAVVLLVRAIFKNRVPKRMLYALWLVVLLKLCLPGTLVSLPVLPAEDAAVLAQSAERPVQTAPVIQRPAQTVTKPQTPAQQPVYKKLRNRLQSRWRRHRFFKLPGSAAAHCSDSGCSARGRCLQFGCTATGVFSASAAERASMFPARSNRRALQGSFRRSI